MEEKEFGSLLFLEFLVKSKKLKEVEEVEGFVKLIGEDLDEPIVLNKGMDKIPERVFNSILSKVNSSPGEFYQWLSTL